ncbi:hypothetical protein F511_43454 [Dorcoceras hygrometricum]|uniref:Dystroglycan-like n=1 Tax=Dorcoceras hygrometricum TaxID=472368 RepID=A0A2Z7CHT2_9LAMI|nr:hypothetical protein F511_43454 [Dorcoceras hygrometricum]
MASSLIRNSHHIDFDTVFGMEDTDLVQMFESLIATGLKNFLGCPAVFNEAALTEFFANSSVREDGLVVSTVNGVTVEFSEEVFSATFELPGDGNPWFAAGEGLRNSDLFTIEECARIGAGGCGYTKGQAYPCEEEGCNKKRPAAGDAEVAPVVKKKRTTKGKPVAEKRLPVEEPVGVSTTSKQPVAEVATAELEPVGGLGIASITEATTEDADAAIEQVLAQLDLVIKDSDVERGYRIETWFDRAFDEEFTTADQENQDSEDEIDFDIDNQELSVFNETRTVPEAGDSKNFGVDKAGEKPIGSKHTTEEHMSIDNLLMQISEDMMLPSVTAIEITKIRLGESINIHEVQERDLYYASLPRISIHDKGKEILEEYELRGQKQRLKIIDLLSAAHSKALEVLLTQQKEHGLLLEQSCSSIFFDDSVGSGAVLAQLFSLAKSTCWIRPMVQIDGVWTPIQGPDFWRSSCKISLFVNKRQVPESMVDTDFVPHGFFIEPVQYWGAAPSLIKTWAWRNVCTEIIRYSMFGCLRPICREIVVYNLGVERIPDYLLSDFSERLYVQIHLLDSSVVLVYRQTQRLTEALQMVIQFIVLPHQFCKRLILLKKILLESGGGSGSRLPAAQPKFKLSAGKRSIQ